MIINKVIIKKLIQAINGKLILKNRSQTWMSEKIKWFRFIQSYNNPWSNQNNWMKQKIELKDKKKVMNRKYHHNTSFMEFKVTIIFIFTDAVAGQANWFISQQTIYISNIRFTCVNCLILIAIFLSKHQRIYG